MSALPCRVSIELDAYERRVDKAEESAERMEPRRGEAICRVMAKILSAPNSIADGPILVEAFAEGASMRHIKSIEGMLVGALVSASDVEGAIESADCAEIGRIFCELVTDYLKPRAEAGSDDELARMDEAETDA